MDPAPSDATPESDRAALPGSAETVPTRPGLRIVGIVAVAVVLVAAVVLRFVTRSDLWLDEALSVNIAKLPLSKLHAALKRDGAPPLFYVALHLWIKVFGSSDVAVRALSGVAAVATLPAYWLIGRRLGGKQLALITLLVGATAPFAFRYASEARMYSLVMLLVAWGLLAVWGALDRPTLPRLAAVTVVGVALLYTHNWSLYLVAVVGLMVLVRALRAQDAETKRASWLVFAALGVAGLGYVPWLPTLAYQAKHTGTPWGDPILPWSGLAWHFESLGGVAIPVHAEAEIYRYGTVLLLALGVFGAGVDRRHVSLDLRTQPRARWLAVAAYGTFLVAMVASYVAGAAFDPRYSSVMVPLVLVLIALGIATFVSDAVRIGVLCVVVVLGLGAGVRVARDQRTEAGEVAAVIRAEAKPGDVVLYCPDQLGPSSSRLLAEVPGLRQVTYPRLTGPEFVNWIDYRKVIAATPPAEVAAKVLDLAGDHTVWYVNSPGYRSFDASCEDLGAALGKERFGVGRVGADQVNFFEYVGLTQYPGS